MGQDVLESLAALEAAYADLAKRIEDEAWQLTQAEGIDVSRRLHALESKARGTVVRMVREVDARSIPTATGAVSLRAFVSGALRLSPHEASRLARLATSLHEEYAATGAALADGGVNFEQAARISWMLEHLPSKATVEQREWAEGFLLEHARVLHADDLARLAKRIDAAIDPDGTLPREKLAAERRSANVRNNHDGTQTLTWRDTDEVIVELRAALTALDAPISGEGGAKDTRTPQIRRADAMQDIVHRAVPARRDARRPRRETPPGHHRHRRNPAHRHRVRAHQLRPVPPTSTTSPSSAGTTTTSFTTARGRSTWRRTEGRSSGHRPGSTRSAPRRGTPTGTPPGADGRASSGGRRART